MASHTNLYWLEVWISMARWSRICRTIVNGYTGWLASIKYIAVSMVIRTPVRPMPALQCTTVGSTMPALAWRTGVLNQNSHKMVTGAQEGNMCLGQFKVCGTCSHNHSWQHWLEPDQTGYFFTKFSCHYVHKHSNKPFIHLFVCRDLHTSTHSLVHSSSITPHVSKWMPHFLFICAPLCNFNVSR